MINEQNIADKRICRYTKFSVKAYLQTVQNTTESRSSFNRLSTDVDNTENTRVFLLTISNILIMHPITIIIYFISYFSNIIILFFNVAVGFILICAIITSVTAKHCN